MSLQLSVAVRNAKLDAIETLVGVAPVMELRAGAVPANCAAASSGALLASASLPSDWLAAAAAGVKGKAGTWTVMGVGAGTIGYFRIFEAGSPQICHAQGTVTATGAGGDMTVDNTNIAVDQVVTVNSFNLTEGNA